MTKGIRGNFTKTGIVCLALLLALGTMGVGYAHWSDTVTISGTAETGEFNDCFGWVVSNDDGVPDGVIDPGDNGLDPYEPQTAGSPCGREDMDVASTTALLEEDPHYMTVTLTHAYPCYYPTLFYSLKNDGTIPSQIVSITVDEEVGDHITTPDIPDNIPELFVTVTGIYIGQNIDPGEEVTGDLEIHVTLDAEECHTYAIRVTIITIPWNLGGTPGYWQNWDQHYSPEQVNEWLGNIDADSDWLVPDMDGNGTINTDDMDAIRDAATGKGSTMEDRFLSQYLSTRLNVEADRLDADASYDFSSYDPDGYLELDGQGTLLEIISAIEDKYDTSPNKDEFEIMKNVCCALNELAI